MGKSCGKHKFLSLRGKCIFGTPYSLYILIMSFISQLILEVSDVELILQQNLKNNALCLVRRALVKVGPTSASNSGVSKIILLRPTCETRPSLYPSSK